MSENQEPQFLYLTTIGRKSGKPHQIEIWFVAREGSYYLINEGGDADWLRNIGAASNVTFSVGGRDADQIDGMGRVIDPETEPDLAAAVRALMDEKYQWSDGTIVELKPRKIGG